MGCVKSTCPVQIKGRSLLKSDEHSNLLSNSKSNYSQKVLIKNLITRIESKLEDNYKILSKLGKGGFGSVYKVQSYKTSKICAMKVVRIQCIKLQDDEQKFLKEIEILCKLEHPNIIKIYEYFIDDVNYYLITEYVSGGELYEFILNDETFSEYKAKNIMRQLFQALNYLHVNNVVHRDIKSENILVDRTYNIQGEEIITIKLIDFGTCNYIKHKGMLTLRVGSPFYIAPEVLKGNYNNKCDIWSAGILLHILLVGQPPFCGNSREEVYQKIQLAQLDFDEPMYRKISSEGKDLLKKTLTKRINKRLSAQDCLNHPWFLSTTGVHTSNCSKTMVSSALKHFISFNAKEKLQQATLAYIVHFLYCNQEINELKTVFKQLDINNDGKLTVNELKNGFKIYYGKIVSDIEMNHLMENIDGDADGFISYEEFLRVTVNTKKLLEEKNLLCAFERFDLDGDGKLSKDELSKVLYGSDIEYIDEILKEIDMNKDGYVNFQEFKSLMNNILLVDKSGDKNENKLNFTTITPDKDVVKYWIKENSGDYSKGELNTDINTKTKTTQQDNGIKDKLINGKDSQFKDNNNICNNKVNQLKKNNILIKIG